MRVPPFARRGGRFSLAAAVRYATATRDGTGGESPSDPETAVPLIIELVKTRIPRRFGLDPIRDIQVLCPMNRGGVGARSLNIEL
jgi:hypothetical protein